MLLGLDEVSPHCHNILNVV